MSILLEIAKALSKIDNKVDMLYSNMGPIAEQIGKDAISIQRDKAILLELQRSCLHPTGSMLAEANIAVADRRSKEMLAAGDKHPNVLAMQDARALLPTVGNLQTLIRAGQKAAEDLESVRLGISAQVEKQVEQYLRYKFDELEGEKIGEMKGLHARINELENRAKAQLGKVEYHQKTLEDRLTSTTDNFNGYEARMQKALQKANDGLAETYAQLDRKFESICKSRSQDKNEILAKLRDKQKKFIEVTYDEIQEESIKISETISKAVAKLESKHKELQSLADKAELSIIETNKTTARIGNLTPKPRSRIRNG